MRVIQRLFGVSMAFSADQELTGEARERIREELNAALKDLRTALGRPLGRMARPTQTTFAEEFGRLVDVHPELGLSLDATLRVPEEVEPLAQSVLIEAVRNASKHADPTSVDVSVAADRRHVRDGDLQRRHPRAAAPGERDGPAARRAGGASRPAGSSSSASASRACGE